MRDFFLFFYDARGGILVFVLLLLALLVVVRTVMWMFALGRWRSAEPPKTASSIGYVIADFFVKLIDDFRHLLALFLVSIFAAVLAYSLWKVHSGGAEEINKALQAVMATLGGLIGSIVGYYFGESAARKAQKIQQAPPSGPQPRPDTTPIAPVSDQDTSAPQGSNL